MTVRTRFAPSPTGFLHIGGVRTALFSWLYAQKYQGEFVLRIEDTDYERSKQEATTAILEDLAWLGLTHSHGPFYQSKRASYYEQAVERLLNEGKAYHCYCTREELDTLRHKQQASGQKPRYDGRCRDRKTSRIGVNPVVRFKSPTDGIAAFDDLVQGRIEVKNSELDDLILLRSNGTPTYNLTVVVDDADMKITHVIRGNDHINNTPRQIHIFEALEANVPQYAHLPMILNEDGSRMSKRNDAVAISYYRKEGYLEQAVLNYLLRLGWSSGNREIFSRDEMIKEFNLENVNVSAASLNLEKLKWLNQQYLQTLPTAELAPLFESHLSNAGFTDYASSAAKVFYFLRTRYKTLKEMAEGAAFIYGKDTISYEKEEARHHLKLDAKLLLEDFLQRLEALEIWDESSIQQAIKETLVSFKVKIGRLGPPLRFAITGGVASPELAITVMLIGRKLCVERIKKALEWIRERKD